MTKHHRKSTKSHSRRRRTQKRVHRGGNYSSAATYGSYVNGGMNSQFDRVFNSPSQSASSIGAQGQNANTSVGVPTASNLALAQAGGRRRKNNSRKNKRGGVLGSVISQAIVPFGILAMQQRYKRKSNKSTHSRKR